MAGIHPALLTCCCHSYMFLYCRTGAAAIVELNVVSIQRNMKMYTYILLYFVFRFTLTRIDNKCVDIDIALY